MKKQNKFEVDIKSFGTNNKQKFKHSKGWLLFEIELVEYQGEWYLGKSIFNNTTKQQIAMSFKKTRFPNRNFRKLIKKTLK